MADKESTQSHPLWYHKVLTFNIYPVAPPLSVVAQSLLQPTSWEMDEKGVVTALAVSCLRSAWWCSIFTRAGTSFLWDNALFQSLLQWYRAVFSNRRDKETKLLWTKSVFGSWSWSVDDFNGHKCDWKAGLLQLNEECISSVKTASHPCNAIWSYPSY